MINYILYHEVIEVVKWWNRIYLDCREIFIFCMWSSGWHGQTPFVRVLPNSVRAASISFPHSLVPTLCVLSQIFEENSRYKTFSWLQPWYHLVRKRVRYYPVTRSVSLYIPTQSVGTRGKMDTHSSLREYILFGGCKAKALPYVINGAIKTSVS